MSEKTYRIGEAAAKLNLKTYVLRFWEMEFPQIAPIRTEKGQRLYTGAHLAILRRIRYLLHERGLTIEGARRLLREEAARGITYDESTVEAPPDGMDADSPDGEAAGKAVLGGGEPPDTGPEPAQASLFSPQTVAVPASGQAFLDGVISELHTIKRILKPEA